MSVATLALDEIFGLPAHPLLVHAAVVLIPLGAITMLVALWPKWRRSMLVATAILAVSGAIFILAAANTGGALEERAEGTSDRALINAHAEAGERAQAPAVLFAGVAVLALGAELLRGKDKKFKDKSMPTWAPAALLAATVVTGAVSAYTVIDAGHTGAKSVWNKVAGNSSGSQSEGDDD